jgi:tRNA-uridine 2-sulfurtransferase
VVDHRSGVAVGSVDAVELVTVGQRRGLRLAGASSPRYVVAVDAEDRRVYVGGPDELATRDTPLEQLTWVGDAVVAGTSVRAQTSAHGVANRAVFTGSALRWSVPVRRVAPGQTVALYDEADVNVLGGAIAS